VFRRTTRAVTAVDGVSFDVAPGEVVGFLGPNGAGKTTTLKLLAGLLHPTGGEARVLGVVPHRRERAFLRRITMVMGNRQQLAWDLPVGDSFEVQRAVYGVPLDAYRAARAELADLLELGPLLGKPVRQLSLGERMKCELAAALLHRPRMLFLDEPTIGLDVTMQRRVRAFLAEYNRRHGATVLLTSHYMADVEALCERVLVIDRGRLLFDGALAALVERFSPDKTITVALIEGAEGAEGAAVGRARDALGGLGEVVTAAPATARLTVRVPRAATAAAIGRLVAAVSVADVTVADPPLEEVIERVFAQTPTAGAVAPEDRPAAPGAAGAAGGGSRG
jgi:ABC-2 type transport system ATP-binding protein